MQYKSCNPYTRELNSVYDLIGDQTLNQTLEQAEVAFENWRRSPLSFRTDRLLEIAELLQTRETELARLITIEMGKPINQSKAEIRKCVSVCRFYVEKGPDFLAPQYYRTPASESYVQYDPLGVILAIMPWNFPFWQVFRCAIPTLLAGNAFLLKHAPNVPQCSLAIAQLFADAGLPVGLFQQIFADETQIAHLIAQPAIKGVTLTGSDRAGSAIAKLAGAYLKPCVMELGGSDPFIVLKDADIGKAAWFAAKSRFNNTGQTCIAAKRILVEEAVFDLFCTAFVAEVQKLHIQDPSKAVSNIGPMARPDLVENLDRQVQASINLGAKKIVVGGPDPENPNIYHPEVLVDVHKDMPVLTEEVFGPVAVLEKVANEKVAIQRANETAYGLGAALWTSDLQKAKQLVSEIHAGFVSINGMVRSMVELPFGGVKRSGLGRELSKEGILAFTNVKTVVI
ncbi:MAG: NAD-dependent succinate-semialdehyde dehydrogenase [Bacteroidota bacterium]